MITDLTAQLDSIFRVLIMYSWPRNQTKKMVCLWWGLEEEGS